MEYLSYIFALIGFVGGFALGLAALGYITRGMKKRELLENHDAKLWLGLLGWFFAIIGGWLGYKLGGFIAYAYR